MNPSGWMRVSSRVKSVKLRKHRIFVSLGNLTYTPCGFFTGAMKILDDLSQLKGKRIVIGPEGSGIVRKFALELLKAADASGPPTELYDFAYTRCPAGDGRRPGGCGYVIRIGRQPPACARISSRKGHPADELQPGGSLHTSFPGSLSCDFTEGVINPSKKFPPSDIPPFVSDDESHRAQEVCIRPGLSAVEGLR